MTDDTQKVFTYHAQTKTLPEKLGMVSCEVICFDGDNPPYWAEDEDGMYRLGLV